MNRKNSSAHGIAGGIAGGAVLGLLGKRLYQLLRSVPAAAKGLGMRISKAPGNIGGLQEYTAQYIAQGGKTMDKIKRLDILDRVIAETADAVNAGKADVHTLAGLVRERELMTVIPSAGENLMDAIARAGGEHPLLTGTLAGAGGLAGIQAVRNRKKRDYWDD